VPGADSIVWFTARALLALRRLLGLRVSRGCFLQLLDFLQQAASALGLAAILLLVVALPPNADRTRRAAAIATLVFLAGVGAAACIVSAHEACSTGARSFASVASVCSQTLVVVAFAPQLVETWRTQGRGSLSYTYYVRTRARNAA